MAGRIRPTPSRAATTTRATSASLPSWGPLVVRVCERAWTPGIRAARMPRRFEMGPTSVRA
eukprot:2300495-Alexandrium_andersonii.AAC.1